MPLRRSHRIAAQPSATASAHCEPPGLGEHAARRRQPRPNVLHRLRDREIGSAARCSFQRESVRETFSNIGLRHQLDMHPQGSRHAHASRSRIVEIACAGGVAVGLTATGVCCAYDLATGHLVGVLNEDADEVVRSLFVNMENGSLITVSVYAEDHYGCLRCWARPLARLCMGDMGRDATDRLFEHEGLRWPGFVEFDDVNAKILTFSSTDSQYKVWSMAQPRRMLYGFSSRLYAEGILEVKISPGIMLLVCAQESTRLLLRVLSVETGECLRTLYQPIYAPATLEILEQFNEMLLLKQQGHAMRIVNVLTNSVLKVKDDAFNTPPSTFIFLHEHSTFLAIKDCAVACWNFKGECVGTFDDHALCSPESALDLASVIHITQRQDVIISLCFDGTAAARAAVAAGGGSDARPVSIHISSISSGKCLARVQPTNSTSNALPSDMTALCYCEESGNLVTGTGGGQLQVWSN